MTDKRNKSLLILGILISKISFTLAFLKINHWYFPAVIGVWFIFDYIAYNKNKNTTLSFLFNDKKKFFNLYLVMFFLGATIELIGRFLLNLWDYPFINNLYLEFVLLLFYPFILFSFRELYESIILKLKNKFLAFISAMVAGIIIWEIPNLFSKDWIYTIPYISFNIIGINIIVIIGWVVLIGFPVYIYNNFFKKLNNKYFNINKTNLVSRLL